MTKEQQSNCCNKHRSGCPITCTLELIGDIWSLLLIRDILIGKHRYGDFERSPEHIPTNILADRLKRLVTNNILEKKCYQMRPVRYAYQLTLKGAELIPILHSIAKWGLDHNIGEWTPPENFWALTPEQVLINQKASIGALMPTKGIECEE